MGIGIEMEIGMAYYRGATNRGKTVTDIATATLTTKVLSQSRDGTFVIIGLVWKFLVNSSLSE